MILSIMQPYIFPYIGYFQLIANSDTFVIYDDVAYIKQGWINRNRILVDGKALLFSIPISNASSFTPINGTRIDLRTYNFWKKKFFSTLAQNYRRAPYFSNTMTIVERVFDKDFSSVAGLSAESIHAVIDYLSIDTIVIPSSSVFNNSHLSSSARVIDICRQTTADTYVNVISGKHLYSKQAFSDNGVILTFLTPVIQPYKQFENAFVPGLSMIDILMFNPKDRIRAMLAACKIS